MLIEGFNFINNHQFSPMIHPRTQTAPFTAISIYFSITIPPKYIRTQLRACAWEKNFNFVKSFRDAAILSTVVVNCGERTAYGFVRLSISVKNHETNLIKFKFFIKLKKWPLKKNFSKFQKLKHWSSRVELFHLRLIN